MKHSIEWENKRVASRYKRYNGLSEAEKKQNTQKKVEAKKEKRKKEGKFKQTIPGKHYKRGGSIKFSGFNKYKLDISHILKSNKCKYCGKGYYGRHMGKDFCSKECYEKYRTQIGWIGIHKCKTCGKEFKPKRAANSTYCSVQCANRDKELNHNIISQTNLKREKWFNSLGYETFLEFPLGELSYDIKINGNILVEINPSIFHSSTYSPYGDKYKKDRMYHYNKTHYAIDNGYKCINIRDWTTEDEIIEMLNNDFIYEGEPNLHWCNRKTGEYYNDKIENKYIVGIYDSGIIKFI